MRDLHGWMSDLRGALSAGDMARAAGHARAIAVACDDQDVHAFDPAHFGPRFGEIDEELHAAAAAMATAAVAEGDLEDARGRYAPLLSSCVACHAQAPSASHVVLDDLQVTEWP